MKVVALFALFACGGSTAMTDAGTDAAVTDYKGQVTDIDGSAIASAQICVLHSNLACQTTDGSGNFTFPLPVMPGAELAVEVSADGYLGTVALLDEPVEGSAGLVSLFIGSTELDNTAQAGMLLGSAGITYPGTGGFLDLRLSGSTAINLSGATVAMSPAAGIGPLYFGSDGIDPTLTSSTTNGYVRFGDVPAGMYDLTASAPNKTCTVSPEPASTVVVGDWGPTTAGTTTRVEIADNALTLNVVIYCL